jgi:hypothetical protein
MIEIIVLYFLIKRLGVIAEQKGEPPLKWKILGVLAWIAGEMSGVTIILTLLGQNNFVLAVFFGLGMAYLFFLLLKSSLTSRPDFKE